MHVHVVYLDHFNTRCKGNDPERDRSGSFCTETA
jgi:hypothetical protein